MKRLNKKIVELNISISRAKTELNKFSGKTYNEYSKLTEKEEKYLDNIFELDKKKKQSAKILKSNFYQDIDNEFSFTDKEREYEKKLVEIYEKTTQDIDNLKKKLNKYWALDEAEINTLLKFKYFILSNLQKKVKEDRETKSNYQSTYDPYEGFKFGGLEGEEAYTAYWNCE